jgi:hypothetical protein
MSINLPPYPSAAVVVAERAAAVKVHQEFTLAAMQRHEQAAELQEHPGYPERAAEACAHAKQARGLHRLAAEELADYRAQITAVKDKAGRPPPRLASPA